MLSKFQKPEVTALCVTIDYFCSSLFIYILHTVLLHFFAQSLHCVCLDLSYWFKTFTWMMLFLIYEDKVPIFTVACSQHDIYS